MPKQQGPFVSHSHCTEAGGDCFALGRCLAACSAGRKKDHEARIRELERTVVRLEQMISRRTP